MFKAAQTDRPAHASLLDKKTLITAEWPTMQPRGVPRAIERQGIERASYDSVLNLPITSLPAFTASKKRLSAELCYTGAATCLKSS